MAFNNNITPGSPPLLWSSVHEAFTKVNENFDILAATVGGGSGLTPLNFETLDTSVSPASSNIYDLGSSSNQWGAVYTSEFSFDPGSELNGVWIGSAQIKGVSGTVELPAGALVDGNLIIDPAKTFFKSVQVDQGNQVVANTFADTLEFVSGTAMQLVVDSSAESITFNNTGVTSLVAGTAISVSGSTGNITVNNTGVTSVTAGSSISGRVAGTGISVSAETGSISITNTGLIGVTAGFGINISNDPVTGVSQISYNPTSAPQTGFTSIAVPGQSTVAANTISDTLNLNAGYGIILTTTELTDTITFTLNQNIDIRGSVFGDDSSVLVDGASNRIIGDVYNNIVHTNELRTSEVKIALGFEAGKTTQQSNAIAIGNTAGNTNQRSDAIAIGYGAGQNNQGLYSIGIGGSAGNNNQGQGSVAIGYNAGVASQGMNGIAIGSYASSGANSIVLNASGGGFAGSGTGMFYVNPIRSTTGTNYVLHYNTGSKEVSYSDTLVVNNVSTSSIRTSDSSALTIHSPVSMLTGLSVGSDIIFADGGVQSTSYAGGQGHMLMIDTNRSDTYTELGTADRPFKTVAAAMAACAAANPTGVLPYTFVLMGCTISENVDFTPYNFNFITVATTCRSTVTGTFTAGNSNLKQLVIRNLEFANTFTLQGDATSGQFANTSIYNASFSGAVNITTVNNVAFYEAAFFGLVNISNINYMYINGGQFNEDLTFTVDDTGATAVPSNGIGPMVILGFNFIANNVYLSKVGGGAAYIVFQPHMARMGLSGGSYSIPSNFIFLPQGCAIRGTWTNNGSTTLRNSSFDVAVRGTAPAYTGVIGGDRVVADSAPATSKGAVGDRVGMMAASAGYLYICTADWTNGTVDIWSRTAISATTW